MAAADANIANVIVDVEGNPSDENVQCIQFINLEKILAMVSLWKTVDAGEEGDGT